MKHFFLLIAVVLSAIFASAGEQEVTLQTLPPGMVLDDNRPAETERTIKQAAATNRIDILYLAMHNKVFSPIYFDQMTVLEKTKHAQLLSRILVDEQIIQPKEYTPVWDAGPQMSGQERAFRQACFLLGEQPPQYFHLLTRAELTALSARLKAVQ